MSDSKLEDLDLFGSDQIDVVGAEIEPQYNGVDAPPASPPSRSPVYDPVGWNLALSPVGNDLFSSDPRYSHDQIEPNLVNAVHMHVQDNARIPNYNHPVDRSNSSNSKNFPRNNYTSDALLPFKAEQDNSMAEIFLSSESRYRKSLNQAYEVLGSLSTEDSIQKEIDELAAVSVDPTPWSEIQDQIVIEGERGKHQQAQRQHQQLEQPPVTARAPISFNHPHQSSYYPYGRDHQLSIPEQSRMSQTPPPTTPPTQKNTAGQDASKMAEALATAAAIARSNSGDANAVDNNGNISSAKEFKTTSRPGIESSTSPPYIPQPRPPNEKVPNAQLQPKMAQSRCARDGKKTADSNRHLQRQRGNANPPPHAAAHTISRASVLAATNRKSQYGFGGNHIVPSVPAPPSFRSSNQRKNKLTPKKTTVTVSTKKCTAIPKIPTAIPNGGHPALPVETNNGSSYERKKQKAKDARVKLNESIERLAIAVSLAGSQSKARIDQLENEIVITKFRPKSIAVNQEGIKLAENAKKWDRPSFVGTAASVIQSLNAQCEALMAELMALNQILDTSKRMNGNTTEFENLTQSTDGTNAEVLKSRSEQSNSPVSNQSHKRHQQPADPIENTQSPNKRLRLSNQETENLPRNDEVIFGSVAQMLDPVSLCRCACTSKVWKELNAFEDEKIWLNMAVKRYGIQNVRKWSENLKDGESEEIISNKHLYEEMNASNVMPHFSQEGLTFLGNGRIKGKLSGWVFVVQRSNGETLRSVKRDPISRTSAGYQSRPVVELKIVVQNTGMATQPIVLKSQKMAVDVSTRRRGGEFEEISWDDRFKKVVRNTDGTIRVLSTKTSKNVSQEDLCHLELFETAVMEVHINAGGCSTISKFRRRSNFTKILAALDGTTVPMVIPFLKHDVIF